MQEIDQLRQQIAFLEQRNVSENCFDGQPYPSSLAPFPGTLIGQGFFAGGDGLWHKNPRLPADGHFPVGGMMLLGNDFGCLEDFKKCLINGFEDPPTWKIKKTLDDAGIPLARCFFTNCYLGLRRTGPSTGTSPGLSTPGFMQMCLEFFDSQISILQPKAIVCLGKEPRQFLAKKLLAPRHSWLSNKSFSQLDSICAPIQMATIKMKAAKREIPVATIFHPSYADLNHRQSPRSFANSSGVDAERELLAEVWRLTRY